MNMFVPAALTALLSNEPVGVMLAIAAALLLFGSRYSKSKAQLTWGRNIIFSIVSSGAFLALIVGGYYFVASNIRSFNEVHQTYTHYGSSSWEKWKSATHTWPGDIIQAELRVNHFVEKRILTTLPATDPLKPALYVSVVVREQIPQNSIVAFKGNVELILEKEKNPDGFNVFRAKADFIYDVVNQSDLSVETDFIFPLDSARRTYENLRITADDVGVKLKKADYEGLHWTLPMSPRQKIVIHVMYDVRGMEGYTYTVPTNREINNFAFTVSTSTRDVFVSFFPPGDTISFRSRSLSGGGVEYVARADKVVASPSVSLAFVQTTNPYAPQDLSIGILMFLPRGVIMLSTIFIILFLIAGEPPGLRDALATQALAWAHILTFMFASPLTSDPKPYLFLSAGFVSLLGYIVLQGHSRLPRVLIFLWTFFLLGLYPLISRAEVYPDNKYDSFVLVGLFVCLFSYTLYKRIEENLSRREEIKSWNRSRIIHWLARVFSIPCSFLFGLVVVAAIEDKFSPTNVTDFLGFLVYGCFIFLPIIAWKFERFGGMALLLVDFGLAIPLIIFSQFDSATNSIFAILMVSVLPGIVGALFLYGWRLKKQNMVDDK